MTEEAGFIQRIMRLGDAFEESGRGLNVEPVKVAGTADSGSSLSSIIAENEDRWRMAIVGSNDGIWDYNASTGYMFLSKRWKTMLGYGLNDLDGSYDSWFSLIHPEDRERITLESQRHLSGESEFYQVEHRLRCKDGSYKWVLSRGKAMFDDKGELLRISGTHTDISGHIKVRDELQALNRQFHEAVEASPDGLVVFDRRERVSFVNTAFSALTGIGSDDVYGQSGGWLIERLEGQAVIDEGWKLFRRRLGRASLAGEGWNTVITLSGAPKLKVQTEFVASSDRHLAGTLLLRKISVAPLLDKSDSSFLSIAAHELRGPMASIYGFSEVLLNQDMGDDLSRELLTVIHKQSAIMSAMLDNLLDLARLEAYGSMNVIFTSVPVDRLVHDTVKGFVVPDDRSPVVLCGLPSSACISGDESMLSRALRNLISNAYKYSNAGTDIEVRVGRHLQPDGKERLSIAVADQGVGMTEKQRARVFDKFYRAKTMKDVQGTGLGMSIVKEIMALHRGEIELQSRMGKGTTVHLLFPCEQAEQ